MEEPQKEEITVPVTIRRASVNDLETIISIYNEAIVSTTATFDTEPKTVQERMEWFHDHDERHPIFVAELGSLVVGWVSLSRWSERRAYDDTAEVSIYIDAGHRRRGFGSALMKSIIVEAERMKYHSLIARIAEPGEGSLRLTGQFDFARVGTLKEAGRKFGKYLDVILLQKMLH